MKKLSDDYVTPDWVIPDGRALTKEDYPELFEILDLPQKQKTVKTSNPRYRTIKNAPKDGGVSRALIKKAVKTVVSSHKKK